MSHQEGSRQADDQLVVDSVVHSEEASKKDVEQEINALLAKSKHRLDGVRATTELNAVGLKSLQKGFRELRKQQVVVARDQTTSVGHLEAGLRTA
mmetsp:Transcript_46953/g.124780  ORF Transcript_46953/g.124780 Transcript_46953/m.124780 type:complete len:95 (+) Transcript_46953:206-490(+)|eukprot:CAMPEP_0194522530 /NCGR_PEP_ID=MMETSP0253-20130528/57127_1 /TAXON_ID=2966 /ORGANISM="Noctiluca scintillans" /LENGTH=94 /DNA_ID=CAMNT_0039366973 /DNA_START=159 /DNA_END=443 /DNA_ORIENTATION=+